MIMPDWFVGMVAVIAWFYFIFKFSIAFSRFTSRYFSKLSNEAREKGKLIELSSMIAAMIAVGVSLGSLLYSAKQIDTLTDRVAVLEKALDAMKAKPEAPKP